MLMDDFNFESLSNDIFKSHHLNWNSQIQYQQIIQETNPISLTENYVKVEDPFLNMTFNSLSNITTTHIPYDLVTTVIDEISKCSYEHQVLYNEAKLSFRQTIIVLNTIFYFIIIIGILFNVLNLIVLLNSKLNESPYTYLTILALSDLGALLMVGAEKIRQFFPQTLLVQNMHVFFIAPLINIFLSCSMYITLALTIERFIFVHSPFKVVSFCRKSIARRVCVAIFVFSIIRSLYLPFMYSPNCSNGYNQKETKLVDIYEFLVSLAIPYTIILIANISLIKSLKKQNSLMNVSLLNNISSSLNGGFSTNNSSNNTLNKPTGRTKRSDTIVSSELHSLCETETIKSKRKSTTSLEMRFIKNESAVTGEKKFKLFKNHSTSSLPTKIENIADDVPKIPSFSKINNTCQYKTSILYHRTSSLRELKNQRKLTTTLIIILWLLLVCYLPSFFFEESLANFIFGSHENPEDPKSILAFKIKSIGYRISILLIYFNCSCNFLIYCFCNKKFKNSLKLLIKKSFLYKIFNRVKESIFCCIWFKKNKRLIIYNSHLRHHDKNYVYCMNNNRNSLKQIIEEKEYFDTTINMNEVKLEPKENMRIDEENEHSQMLEKMIKFSHKMPNDDNENTII